MHQFFTPPTLIEPLTTTGWVGVGILGIATLVLVLITSLGVDLNRSGSSLVFHGLSFFALFSAILRLYRAAPPGIHWSNYSWVAITASVIVITLIGIWLFFQRTGEIGGVAIFGGTVVLAIFAAALMDKANEQLAIIPLSWGGILILVIAFVLVVKDRA